MSKIGLQFEFELKEAELQFNKKIKEMHVFQVKSLTMKLYMSDMIALHIL